MAGAFSEEVVRKITRELMPYDGREHEKVHEIQQALAELNQGLPERIIRMLEVHGRDLGQHRHEIDSLIVILQE